MNRLKALYERIPVGGRKEALHVGRVFIVTFVATAGPLLPAVIQTPSFSAVHALVAAALAAALGAAYVVAKQGLKRAFRGPAS